RQPGIEQVQVKSEIGFDFARSLRSILRQDPDIIMVGEIRDAETAQIAVRAALTGHLVLSTLHTNDAISTLVRLINIGVEPFLVATAVNMVAAQRLVKKICLEGKEGYRPSPQEIAVFGAGPAPGTLYPGTGEVVWGTGVEGVAEYRLRGPDVPVRGVPGRRPGAPDDHRWHRCGSDPRAGARGGHDEPARSRSEACRSGRDDARGDHVGRE